MQPLSSLGSKISTDILPDCELSNEELIYFIQNSPDSTMRSAAFLHLLKTGKLNDLKKLVDYVNLDFRETKTNMNAVLVACWCGRANVLEWLVSDLHQSLEVTDENGFGPIEYAIFISDTKLNTKLLHQLVTPVEEGGFGLQFKPSTGGNNNPVFRATLWERLQTLHELEKPVAEGGFGLSLKVRDFNDYGLDQVAINSCGTETIAELLKPRELGGFGIPVDGSTLMMHFPENQKDDFRNKILFCKQPEKNEDTDIIMLDVITGEAKVYKPVKSLGHGGYGTICLYQCGPDKLVMKKPNDGWSELSKHYDNQYAAMKKKQLHEYKYLRLAYPEFGPYVLQFYRHLDTPGSVTRHNYRMIMPLVPGDCINECLASDATPLQVAQAFLSACEELQRIHELGILHGDVRPGNIMIEATGDPGHPYKTRFIDFYLAYRIGKNATSFSHESPEFLSPERTRWDVLGHPSQDIFGLASTFFCCLSNKNSPLLSRQDEIRSALPVLDKFIIQGMRYSPEMRPDLRQVIDELKEQIASCQCQEPEEVLSEEAPLSKTGKREHSQSSFFAQHPVKKTRYDNPFELAKARLERRRDHRAR